MKKSITKNYIYNLCYQFVIIVAPLIVAPYIARVFGANGIGIYSYTQSIVTYFKLIATLGISLYAQIEIAYVQDDKGKRSQLFWEIIMIRLATTVISLLLFTVYALKSGDYREIYLLQMIDLAAVIFDITWFFQGMEDFKKIAYRNIVIKIIEILLIFTFVKTAKDLWIYILCYGLTAFLANISLWTFLRKYIVFVKLKRLRFINHLKPIFFLFIPQIATQIYTVLDKTLLGAITGSRVENGYYEQAQKIVRTALMIITAFGAVMLSRIANEFSENRKDKIQDYIYNSFRFTLFLALPIMFGFISVADSFVPWFFGTGYDKVIILLKILSPIVLCIGLSNVVGMQYLVPQKRQKEFTLSVTLGAVINVIISLALIPGLKSIGAAIASVVAELIVIVIQIYYIRKEISLISILGFGKNYLVSSLLMMGVMLLIEKLNHASFITMLLQIVAGIVTYFVLLTIMKDDSMKFIMNLLKRRRGPGHD